MKTYFFFVVLILFTIILVCSVHGEISSTDKERITSITGTVATVVDKIQARNDALGKAGKAVGTLVGCIGKLAPFLGAAGALLSVILAFIPGQDSAELTFMKNQFAEVNRKLDRLSDKLDDVATLITYETQRATYIQAESSIEYGYKKLDEFKVEVQKTRCTTEKNCERVRAKIAERFVKSFEPVESALDLILKGCVDKTVFRENLLDLVKEKYKCDVGKLTEFMEGIIRLAEKGQEVIVIYDKLTASNVTVVTSVKKWIDQIYKLRNHYYDVKNQCFDKMQEDLDKDVKQTKYQDSYPNNDNLNLALSSALEEKYAWLKWNVLSYTVPHSDKIKGDHAMKVLYGSFNSPPSKEDRKRVIVTAPVDPFGTYTLATKLRVSEAIRNWQGRITNGCKKDKNKCLNAIVNAVTFKGLQGYIQTINVLKTSYSLTPKIKETNPNSYINEEFKFTYTVTHCSLSGYCTTDKEILPVRVVIMLRSKEMREGRKCTQGCSATNSRCVRLPHSKLEECQCYPDFDGEKCLAHSQIGLLSAVDSLVTSTLKVPSLVDIYYNVKDLRKELEAGVTRLDSAISKLSSGLEYMYGHLSKQIGQGFEWTNLKTNYAGTIKNIAFYSKEFQTRTKENGDARGKALAAYILEDGMIREWVQDMETLFMGSSLILNAHLPLMLMYMDRYMNKEVGCGRMYKQRVNGVYKQFSILQQNAYLMWMEAASIMEKEPGLIALKYDRTVEKQNKRLNDVTCEYALPHSQTLNCTGGHYIYPKMKLKNKCDQKYYRHGDLTVSCSKPTVAKTTSCKACNCDTTGASSLACDDVTGKCTCKKFNYQGGKVASYHGTKCESRDCQWSLWGAFERCSTCGYGAHQTRSRITEITRYGNGRSCSGSSRHSKPCFTKCCSGQFNCKNRKKCISGSHKCDYNNDCGDKEDEDDNLCQERCYDYSSFRSTDGRKGNVWYMDRQYVNCQRWSSQYLLQSFRLQRSGGNVYYKYRCCKTNKPIANKQTGKATGWKETRSVIFLDKQDVKCPSDSFMTKYEIDGQWVKRTWQKKRYDLRYSYWCNQVSEAKHRRRMDCKVAFTPWGAEGGKQLWYLDQHDVDCRRGMGSRWFLNGFHLERSGGGKMRYRYTCCRVHA